MTGYPQRPRFALAALALWGIAAIAQAATAGGDARDGKHLFLAVGCYECHGTTGGGASTGPALAPNPMSMAAFIYQLRHPLGVPHYNVRMPAYGQSVLSDAQVADIYAYLASIPPGLPASKIPLLSR